MKNKIITLLGLISCSLVTAQNLGNSDCDSLLLISGWRSDNVHLFDGCDGSYIKNLDTQELMDGPQAIFEDKNNDLVVVSESNNRLIKFDRETLSQATVVSGDDPNTNEFEPALLFNPISAILNSNNDLILSSYSSNKIISVNTDDWSLKDVILESSTQHIQGADIGNFIGPDGQLYVPGYDSDNIIKVNLNTSEVTEVVASGRGGLDAPRAIVFNGNDMYVTSERSNEILKYDGQGNFIESFMSISRPSGMLKDGENSVIVVSPTVGVMKINLLNAESELIIPAGTGGVVGATFVYRLEKLNQPSASTIAKQSWMIGVGEIVNNSITVSNLTTTRNGDFGDDFDAQNIVRQDWGMLNIDFNDCGSADMSYQSLVQDDGYEFGNGGYPLQKLAHNLASAECLQLGMENTSNKIWMAGTWYGGASRSGEGFLIDVLSDSSAVVTWYSYLPVFVTL